MSNEQTVEIKPLVERESLATQAELLLQVIEAYPAKNAAKLLEICAAEVAEEEVANRKFPALTISTKEDLASELDILERLRFIKSAKKAWYSWDSKIAADAPKEKKVKEPKEKKVKEPKAPKEKKVTSASLCRDWLKTLDNEVFTTNILTSICKMYKTVTDAAGQEEVGIGAFRNYAIAEAEARGITILKKEAAEKPVKVKKEKVAKTETEKESVTEESASEEVAQETETQEEAFQG